MDIQFTLDFLKNLAQNNHKEWMDEHKKSYLKAKEHVIELMSEILGKISEFDPEVGGTDPKKALFRINRDIRFSKNKDPYKTNFGAFMAKGGRNSGNPGYYLHLQPGNNFWGGGIYQPANEVLTAVRQEIDYNGNELRSIIENKKFRSLYGEPYGEDRLKTAPKGYPKDHENLHLLQLKHYIFMKNGSDKEVTSNGFAGQVAGDFRTLYPFNQFLSRSLH